MLTYIYIYHEFRKAVYTSKCVTPIKKVTNTQFEMLIQKFPYESQILVCDDIVLQMNILQFAI